jgi:hypothetical protein
VLPPLLVSSKRNKSLLLIAVIVAVSRWVPSHSWNLCCKCCGVWNKQFLMHNTYDFGKRMHVSKMSRCKLFIMSLHYELIPFSKCTDVNSCMMNLCFDVFCKLITHWLWFCTKTTWILCSAIAMRGWKIKGQAVQNFRKFGFWESGEKWWFFFRRKWCMS